MIVIKSLLTKDPIMNSRIFAKRCHIIVFLSYASSFFAYTQWCSVGGISQRSFSDTAFKEVALIVIGIPSSPQNLQLRTAIRGSWKQDVDCDIRTTMFFYIGADEGSHEMDNILDESHEFSDISIYRGPDKWDGRTKKTISMMKHALGQYNSSYFMSVDDDSYLNYTKLLKEIQRLPEQKCYWGNVYKGGEVLVGGKWDNSRYINIIGHRKFAPYMSGAGWIISRDILETISTMEENVGLQTFQSDDVSVGYWISALNVVPTHSELNQLMEFADKKDTCSAVICHKCTPEQMINLWISSSKD